MRILGKKKFKYINLTPQKVNNIFEKVKEIYGIHTGIDCSKIFIPEYFIIKAINMYAKKFYGQIMYINFRINLNFARLPSYQYTLKTLAHELTHYLQWHTNRVILKGYKQYSNDTDYFKQPSEFEAEIISWFICGVNENRYKRLKGLKAGYHKLVNKVSKAKTWRHK